jgi:uncharacterized membrane protein YhaH (DUF805 family)
MTVYHFYYQTTYAESPRTLVQPFILFGIFLGKELTLTAAFQTLLINVLRTNRRRTRILATISTDDQGVFTFFFLERAGSNAVVAFYYSLLTLVLIFCVHLRILRDVSRKGTYQALSAGFYFCLKATTEFQRRGCTALEHCVSD